MGTPVASHTWTKLADSSKQLRGKTLRTLSDLPGRAEELHVAFEGLLFDFSRQFVDAEVLRQFGEICDTNDFTGYRSAMWRGDIVNVTENRAVSHVSLRSGGDDTVATTARLERARAEKFATEVRSGAFPGATGKKFTHVVNIGIGGSDLGPAMVYRALASYASGPQCRFVSNIDPRDLDQALEGLDPQSTLIIVSSKTMSTSETMHNAARARTWLEGGLGGSALAHFAASTASPDAAVHWGVPREHVFCFAESVGGRFSVSSVIGLPLMLGLGPEVFETMLDGMATMDRHFHDEPWTANIPALHAFITVLNSTVHNMSSLAVVPYSHDLARFPAFLQQLLMESNGKSVTADGKSAAASSPVVWGEPGTNGQHAFFQLLHQGLDIIPVDFVAVVRTTSNDTAGQRMLLANLLAQAEVLALGRTLDEVLADGEGAEQAPHRVFSGNRPSSIIAIRELSPRLLGMLMAMYEHSTAVQGWLWGVNSFDQFGVEYGKVVASRNVALFDVPEGESGFSASFSKACEIAGMWMRENL
ncbi:MAG: glucose-6-phosphate isomerase [Ilumatobacteraceae bacterium]|jgi:glucose-6-phosphate isomerase|nr:glucose-6-phosphate isomerase [Ilumatobacteraceae bacterium]